VVSVLDKRDRFRGYHMFLLDGRLGVQLDDGGTFANYITPPTVTVPADDRWHLIAVTVPRLLPNGGTFYIDGAPVGNFNPVLHHRSLNSGSSLVIGARTPAQGSGGRFKGGIDEVEIFDRALSAGKILPIMQAGPAGKCKCPAPPANMAA